MQSKYNLYKKQVKGAALSDSHPLPQGRGQGVGVREMFSNQYEN